MSNTKMMMTGVCNINISLKGMSDDRVTKLANFSGCGLVAPKIG